MKIYGVHYTWVPGHAAHGPVGIWDETGAHYYPPETAEFESAGAYHAIGRPSHFAFSDWLEMKAETTSTTNNWSRVDSDKSMQEVLHDLQTQFFAQDHPVQTFVAPVNDESEEPRPVVGGAERFRLARRRELAESWWIGSELASRHPEWMLHEMHPAGGMADDLAVVSENREIHVHLNREGTIHVETGSASGTIHLSWEQAFSYDSPHGMVKHIERLLSVELRGKRPASTPRTIAYRFLAAILAISVNDRADWDVRNEFLDTSEWIDETARGYLKSFPAAQADRRTAPSTGIWGEPDSHFWAVLRNDTPVAVVSTEGHLYCAENRIDLLKEYRQVGNLTKLALRHLDF